MADGFLVISHVQFVEKKWWWLGYSERIRKIGKVIRKVRTKSTRNRSQIAVVIPVFPSLTWRATNIVIINTLIFLTSNYNPFS